MLLKNERKKILSCRRLVINYLKCSIYLISFSCIFYKQIYPCSVYSTCFFYHFLILPTSLSILLYINIQHLTLEYFVFQYPSVEYFYFYIIGYVDKFKDDELFVLFFVTTPTLFSNWKLYFVNFQNIKVVYFKTKKTTEKIISDGIKKYFNIQFLMLLCIFKF